MSFSKVPLRETARSSDVSDAQQFSLEDVGEIEVYHLDKDHLSVKDMWFVHCNNRECTYREDHGCMKDFCTVDALYESSNDKFYFIEFKAQPSKNIKKKEVWGKAVESLYAASLTQLGAYSMEDIRKNAEFVLVFKNTSPETDDYYSNRLSEKNKSDQAFRKLTTKIREPAGLLDEERNPIYFELEQFREKEFYRDVHTFSEKQFIAWAKEHLC